MGTITFKKVRQRNPVTSLGKESVAPSSNQQIEPAPNQQE